MHSICIRGCTETQSLLDVINIFFYSDMRFTVELCCNWDPKWVSVFPTTGFKLQENWLLVAVFLSSCNRLIPDWMTACSCLLLHCSLYAVHCSLYTLLLPGLGFESQLNSRETGPSSPHQLFCHSFCAFCVCDTQTTSALLLSRLSSNTLSYLDS